MINPTTNNIIKYANQSFIVYIIIIKLNSNNIIYAEPHPISNGRLIVSAEMVL